MKNTYFSFSVGQRILHSSCCSKKLRTSRHIFLFVVSLLFLFLSVGSRLSAQNCTVNAGINRTFCANDTIRLFGQIQGLPQSGTQQWTQVTGPSVLIINPGDLSPMVVGVIGGNSYQFRLRSRCTDGSLVFDNVTYTIEETLTATASGGGSAACPGGGSATLSGNPPGPNETGIWEGGGAGVVLSDVNDPNPTVTLTEGSGGTANFVWTITNDITGCTASSEAIEITNCGGESTVSAGPDQVLSDCFLLTTSTTLTGSEIGISECGQSGEWSVVSGPNIPTIATPNSSQTDISNLIEGTYVFRYEVQGPCASGSDLVEITIPEPVGPSTEANASAPAGTSYCVGVDSFILQGNAPIYSGEDVQWTQLSGPNTATIVSPNAQVTRIADFIMGSYTFEYTITNTTTGCTSSSTVSISIGGNPAVDLLDIGPIVLPCGQTFVDLNYSDGGLGTTSWRFIDRPFGTNPTPYSIVGTASPFTVGGLTQGGTYVIEFRREASSSTGCQPRTDQITVIASGESTLANAGTDQLLGCNVFETMLAGNDPSIEGPEFTGTWSQVSGPNTAIIDDVNAFDTDISNLVPGQYVFRWTITNGLLCFPAQDDVIVRAVSEDPDDVKAGSDQTVCFGTPIHLDGSAPEPNEIGAWSVIPAAGVIFSDNTDPNATVTGLNINTVYTFTWTITNPCNSISDNVTITTLGTQGPVQADAGADLCLPTSTSSTNLSGNAPDGGTGNWSFLPMASNPTSIATPTIDDINNPNTSISGLTDEGTYAFQWQIERGTGCDPTVDTVLVTVSEATTTADAGPDQSICGADTNFEGNTVTVGSGIWTQLSGPTIADIIDPTSPTTSVDSLSPNTTYAFIWTISNGGCPPSRDTVVIATSSVADPANAGSDIAVCGSSMTTLSATPVANGFWTVLSGPNSPTFSDITSPTATISNLNFGSYVLQWNSLGGPFCPTLTDQVTIDVVPAANAGPDQTFCDVISSVNLSGNSNSAGTWTFVSGPNIPSINPTSLNSAIASGLTDGVYVFEYTINSTVGGSPCSSSDQTTVSIFDVPSSADAGVDQELCEQGTFNLNAATPSFGTGTWTIAATDPMGLSGSFTNVNDPNTTFTGAEAGVYIFQWEVANADCSGSDLVRIDNFPEPTIANAGTDFDNCGFTAQLNGNTATSGNGEWTVVSTPGGAPTPNILNPILPNTQVSI